MRVQDDMAEDPVEAARKGLQPNIGVYLENKLRKPLESIFEYVVVSRSEMLFALSASVETPSLAALARPTYLFVVDGSRLSLGERLASLNACTHAQGLVRNGPKFDIELYSGYSWCLVRECGRVVSAQITWWSCQKYVAYCSALVTGKRALIGHFSINSEPRHVLQPQQSFFNRALSNCPENAANDCHVSPFIGRLFACFILPT